MAIRVFLREGWYSRKSLLTGVGMRRATINAHGGRDRIAAPAFQTTNRAFGRSGSLHLSASVSKVRSIPATEDIPATNSPTLASRRFTLAFNFTVR